MQWKQTFQKPFVITEWGIDIIYQKGGYTKKQDQLVSRLTLIKPEITIDFITTDLG